MKAMILVLFMFFFVGTLSAQRVSSTHFFYFNSSAEKLIPSDESKLKKLCDTLKKHELVSITIIGHTDDSGDEDMNLTLSEERAKYVRTVITKAGIADSVISLVAMGESNPVVLNNSNKNKARNRRVELKVVWE